MCASTTSAAGARPLSLAVSLRAPPILTSRAARPPAVRTTTGLVTNTLLVTSRVYGFMAYARLSYVNNWAISLFTVIPRSYNFVDEELLQTASQPDYPPTAAEM